MTEVKLFQSNELFPMTAISKIINWISASMRSSEEPVRLMQRAFPLHQSGDLAAAEALYRRILTITPDDPDSQYLLGCIAQQRGKLDEAIRRVGAAIQFNAGEPEFHRTLASIFVSMDRWQEAAGCWRRALDLDPESASDWNRLGRTLRELRKLEEAQRCFDRANQIDPDSMLSSLGTALICRDLGKIGESISFFRRARASAPEDLALLSSYLFTLNLSTGLSRAEIFEEHLECERLLGAIGRATQKLQAADREQRNRLRIGYMSPDFRNHVMSFFIEPVLAHHDRRRFEVYCYYLYERRDDVSDRLRQLSDRWVDCAKLSDADIAQRIEVDQIDILVDLAGHTDWNRIAVIARRPAPVLATWLGYLNTTGLRSVDYRITDRHTDPPGSTESFHTETLIRLPASQWCRLKPAQSIAASPPRPALPGAVRFGSFNKSSKLTPDALRLWSRVLLRVPQATLLFADVEEPSRDAVREVFRACGVGTERLEFAGRLPHDQFLMLHYRADIALDAYPYSGATTTLDTLWMGVPVLTLAGDAPISRSTASILATLELHDWIARSADEFVEIAARHAGDPAPLAALRTGLRATLENSILMDGARFTGQLEELYCQMWRERGITDR